MSLLLALEMSDQSITAEAANRLSGIRIQDWIAGGAISLRLKQLGSARTLESPCTEDTVWERRGKPRLSDHPGVVASFLV